MNDHHFIWSGTNYVHIHEDCHECGGCILECEHRVKVVQTTTAGTDLRYYDPEATTKDTVTSPSGGTTPSTDQWTSLTSPVDSILNTFLRGLGYEFKVSQNHSNEVWQEARNALQALIAQERNKARIAEVQKILDWYGDTSNDNTSKFLVRYLADLKKVTGYEA